MKRYRVFLLEFLCCKYLLHPEEIRSENLIQLGEQSTAKIAGIQSSGIEFREKSAGCTTASSGVIKKILLAMAVGKCIGVKVGSGSGRCGGRLCHN